MNKVKNLYRYWVDKDSKIIVRQFTDEEYKSMDPHVHIVEKYWTYDCPICLFVPTPYRSKQEAIYGANFHCCMNGYRHMCRISYRYFELACFECREEFVESLGMWVYKQEYY